VRNINSAKNISMKGFIQNVVVKIKSNRFSRILMDWGLWFSTSWVFDSILYPVVIGWLGPIVGGIIMASIAISICWFWMNKIIISDEKWFNMDVMHKIKDIVLKVLRITEKISFIKKTWIDKIEFILTFIALNFVFDPMITTLYFRHGDKTKVLSKKDRNIFIGSALFGNIYWILRSWGIASLVIFVWRALVH